MITWIRIALVAVALGLATPAVAGTGEPFGATAAELRALAAAAEPTDAAAIILLESGRYVYDDSGKRSFRLRRIVEIKNREGVDDWGSVEIGWAPWYQKRPAIRARVLTRDDRFRELHPSTIEEGSAQSGDAHSYSDWRTRRAPLPAVAPGTIVELEIEVIDSQPFFDAGSIDRFYFAMRSVPIARARLEIVVPRKHRLRYDVSLLRGLAPEIERRGVTRRYLFERRDIAPHDVESSLPPDAPRYPNVAFSLGRSWAAVASSYARVVDAQIAAGPVPDGALPKRGKSRGDTIASVLAHVHRNVRYTGLEFDQNAIVPWTPAETWRRGYGDCKDKATLLVAMLRRLGIDAHVALLDSGADRDVRPSLPGLGDFDHAIVYIPGRKPVWIDATVELARANQLPFGDQGRRALVARRGTRRLVTLPADRAGENRIVEDRRVELSSWGSARVVETSRFEGLQELRWRYQYRDAKSDEVAENLESYAKKEYAAKALSSHVIGDTDDLDKSFGMKLVVEDATMASVALGEASVRLPVSHLGQLLPEELASADETPPEPRKRPLDLVPHATVQRYRLVPPPGFVPKSLPKVSHRVAGPLRIVRDVTREGREVVVSYEMAITRNIASPAELEAMRALLTKYNEEDQDTVTFEHRAVALADAGDVVGAIAQQRAIVAAHPGDGSELARLAHLLGEAGLGLESRRVARLAVAADPTGIFPQIILGDACAGDALGRWGERGFDRRCALEAYGRVAKLDPSFLVVRANHALLLSLDDRGVGFADDLERATTELVGVVESGGHDYDEIAVLTLAAAGRFAELGKLAPKLDSEAQAHIARILSVAGSKGADAAVAELVALPELYKTAISTTLSSHIASSQSWDLYRDLHAALARESLPLPELGAVALARLGKDRPAPVDLFARILVGTALGLLPEDPEVRGRYARLAARAMALDPIDFAQRNDLAWRVSADEGDDPAAMVDVMRAMIDASIAGRSKNVRRVRVTIGPDDWDVVAVRELGRWRFLCAVGDRSLLGAQALAFADAGKLADARFLLDIAAAGRPAKLEPFSTPAFFRLWKKGAKPKRRAVTIAAAALAVDGVARARSLEVLESCAARGEDARICSEALLTTRVGRGEWDATAKQRATFAKVPAGTSSTLDMARIEALEASDPERARLVARLPAVQQRLLRGLVVVESGDLDAALAFYLEEAEKEDGLASHSANMAAWIELFVARPKLERAEEVARRATELDPDLSPLHTLATVQAARGDLAAAKENLAKLIEGHGGFEGADWLIYGRMAAECGAVEAARAAYDKVIATPAASEAGNVSSAALAKRWRAAL